MKTFLFKNKLDYLLHLYNDHFVCTSDNCKQWDIHPPKGCTEQQNVLNVNLNKIKVFTTQFDYQQHLTTSHSGDANNSSNTNLSNLSKKKNVNLFEVFHGTTQNNTKSTTAATTTTNAIQPGQARGSGGASSWGVSGNAAVAAIEQGQFKYKTALTADDMLVYKRTITSTTTTTD
eukprot:UN04210